METNLNRKFHKITELYEEILPGSRSRVISLYELASHYDNARRNTERENYYNRRLIPAFNNIRRFLSIMPNYSHRKKSNYFSFLRLLYAFSILNFLILVSMFILNYPYNNTTELTSSVLLSAGSASTIIIFFKGATSIFHFFTPKLKKLIRIIINNIGELK